MVLKNKATGKLGIQANPDQEPEYLYDAIFEIWEEMSNPLICRDSSKWSKARTIFLLTETINPKTGESTFGLLANEKPVFSNGEYDTYTVVYRDDQPYIIVGRDSVFTVFEILKDISAKKEVFTAKTNKAPQLIAHSYFSWGPEGQRNICIIDDWDNSPVRYGPADFLAFNASSKIVTIRRGKTEQYIDRAAGRSFTFPSTTVNLLSRSTLHPDYYVVYGEKGDGIINKEGKIIMPFTHKGIAFLNPEKPIVSAIRNKVLITHDLQTGEEKEVARNIVALENVGQNLLNVINTADQCGVIHISNGILIPIEFNHISVDRQKEIIHCTKEADAQKIKRMYDYDFDGTLIKTNITQN